MPPEQVLGKITSQPFHKIRLARTIKRIPKFNCISLSGFNTFFLFLTDGCSRLSCWSTKQRYWKFRWGKITWSIPFGYAAKSHYFQSHTLGEERTWDSLVLTPKQIFKKKDTQLLKFFRHSQMPMNKQFFFYWIKLFKIYLITYYHMKTRRLLQSGWPWHGFFNKPVTSLLLPYEKLYN